MYLDSRKEKSLKNRFDQRLRDLPASITNDLILRVARVEAFRGWWEGAPKPSAFLRQRVFARTAEESAREATRIAAGASPPEEAGYSRTLRAMFDGYREMPPGEGQIRALHAGIFRDSEEGRLHAGRFKTAMAAARTFSRWDVQPVALRAPGPLLVPAQMEALSLWLDNRIGGGEFHPLLVAAAYILEFLAIRPFTDGNTRVGRMLMNLLLLRCGHAYIPFASLDSALTADWTQHYLMLRKSQASRNLPRPDISPWLLTFLDTLILQQRAARKTIGRLPDERKLSRNQALVLAIAARDGEVTNRKAALEAGMPRETAKQTLNRLASLGALRRMGAGRATRYRLQED